MHARGEEICLKIVKRNTEWLRQANLPTVVRAEAIALAIEMRKGFERIYNRFTELERKMLCTNLNKITNYNKFVKRQRITRIIQLDEADFS